ncbi:putative RNA methyltransferase [Agaricicola taiwanensis]|uniref:Putative RNA methyltransferase n=1 Tax=Agaricicola taiwanensis TaxID=591372 RepID=A0A8J2VPE6_9RHOB|nr:class I SAM-dependent RNA methyltransferase [Agaricicola taiwanensis]GGE35822.1 putative RNA methyltransferase [Agaricicola taiwanensis]
MPQTAPDRVTIERLGSRGEGLAFADAGTLRVPHALPGEVVDVAADVEAGRARLLQVVDPSPHRIAPFCPLFGSCGGCSTQHMSPGFYLAWKTEQVRQVLQAAGITTEIDPCIDAHGAGRRRVTLHARRGNSERITVGFAEMRSHALVPIEHCPILVPSLNAALPSLRSIALSLASSGKPLDLAATSTQSGIDLDIRGLGSFTEGQRLKLIDLAAHHDLARLSVHGQVVVERRAPVIQFGRASVQPPAGGFLQATEAGEEALAALVVRAVGKSSRIADLFSGCGTFALRLAERASVHAVEGDKAASAALDHARRHAQGLKRVTVETRDLFRRPLHRGELAGFDAVVFDPPRAGAEAQARQLAASNVPVLVSVSCSPSTLARDLQILTAGGYTVTRITPVDQFCHSAHVEVVATLAKKRNLP